MLSEKIGALVQEAEEAGTRGDVEQAQGLMKLCDRLKEEKDQLLKQQENRSIILILIFFFLCSNQLTYFCACDNQRSELGREFFIKLII